jgi:uncharacterized protein (TIGR03032 family)
MERTFEPASETADVPLSSLHTQSFPVLLEQLGISLLVTTYQAGKLVILRADQGLLNTHFCNLPKPMGLALRGPQLGIGTRNTVQEYHANPAVAGTREPAGRCDCCFVPRVTHSTGNMQIHEMEWVGDELWFVNTLFSCLAVRSVAYSFQPRWQPPFITSLAPEDRCHLNGLGLRDGRIRYVTALGQSDSAGGWRATKKDGGILMDVSSNVILLGGLSMPHSPRWHQERLWLLESGAGSLGYFDESQGRYQAIATLPGFTRGLDFCGSVAFVGLSQVRESAVFSGIPITERSQERICGVAAVHLDTGKLLGWVHFDQGVQEIFAVRVVQGARYPDLVTADEAVLDGAFILPDEDYQRVPGEYRSSRGDH